MNRHGLVIALRPGQPCPRPGPRCAAQAGPHRSGGRLDVNAAGTAPFVGDFFEDGTRALLVAISDRGDSAIYRNVGTATEPRFDSYTWFGAGGKIASVPED